MTSNKDQVEPWSGRIYRILDIDEGHEYREYQLDRRVAEVIKELHVDRSATNRVVALYITGYEDQHTGQDLVRLARWTLGEESEAYDDAWLPAICRETP